MNTKQSIGTGLALAAALALPHMASAQGRGSFVRPGAQAASPNAPVVQAAPANQSNNQQSNQQSNQPVQSSRPVIQAAPPFTPMRSGALERGSRPSYNTYSNTPSNGNNFGGGNNYGGGNGYGGGNAGMHRGPVVVLPEGPTQTHIDRSGNVWSNNTGSNNTGSNNTGSNNTGRNNFGPRYSRPNYLPPVGPGNGTFNNLTPPVGPANGFFNNLTPPVGPANGFGQNNQSVGRHRPSGFEGRHHLYGPPPSYPVIVDTPPLLGGYYYGGYSENYGPSCTYPSVYSVYSGFPQYIYNPSVIVISQPYLPVYATPYLPFYAPTYQTVYNENTYYVGSQSRVDQLEAGGDQAQEALKNAYPANSFQAAFADIARAWTDGDIALLRRHLRDKDTRISVSLNRKYSYTIASGDFADITRDALDRLQTVSFDFTRLRKAKNGDVTAFGTHVYRVADGTGSTDINADTNADTNGGDGQTIPFDQSGTDAGASPYDQSNDPSNGEEKTVYVSYTLRRHSGEWYITAIDSANYDLAVDRK